VSLNNPRVIDCSSEAARAAAASEAAAADPADGTVAASSSSVPEYTTAKGLTQYFVIVPCKLRLVTLAAFLKWKAMSARENKVMVFTASRDTVRFYQLLLAAPLSSEGDAGEPLLGELPLYFLHGGMTQQERTSTYHKFSEAKHGILFSTDVAARGLHLPKVSWIIQLTAPTSASEYHMRSCCVWFF
jgi:ATP-dependent RNA helicase DDX31/DBP7